MTFLNYQILQHAEYVILKRDGKELGAYIDFRSAVNDLEHRYLLKPRSNEEKEALRKFKLKLE